VNPPRWSFFFFLVAFFSHLGVLPSSQNGFLEARGGGVTVAIDRTAHGNWVAGVRRRAGEGRRALSHGFAVMKCLEFVGVFRHLSISSSAPFLTRRCPLSPLPVRPGLACLCFGKRWSWWGSRPPRSSPAAPASASPPRTPGRTWSTRSSTWKRWWTSASYATAAAPWGTERAAQRQRWRAWSV